MNDKYSKDEKEIIFSFYKDRVVNKIFKLSFPFLIKEIYSIKFKDKYNIRVGGYIAGRSHISVSQDIKNFAKDNGFISPNDLLNNQD